jgi:hypothetical protein
MLNCYSICIFVDWWRSFQDDLQHVVVFFWSMQPNKQSVTWRRGNLWPNPWIGRPIRISACSHAQPTGQVPYLQLYCTRFSRWNHGTRHPPRHSLWRCYPLAAPNPHKQRTHYWKIFEFHVKCSVDARFLLYRSITMNAAKKFSSQSNAMRFFPLTHTSVIVRRQTYRVELQFVALQFACSAVDHGLSMDM